MDYGFGITVADISFWRAFEIWKDLYGEKLVFTVDEEQEPFQWAEVRVSRGMELLMALLSIQGRVSMENEMEFEHDGTEEWIDSAKAFLNLVDRVEWRHREETVHEHWEIFLKYRRAMEELVLQNGDTELLFICLEKNLFPAADIDFLREIYEQDVQVRERHTDLLSLLIMKNHGCLENCVPTSVSR